MADVIKVKLNSAGCAAILKGSEITSYIGSRVNAITDASNRMCSADNMRNKPFMGEVKVGSRRAHGHVWTASTHGVYANNKYDVLQKCLYAGR